MNRYKKIKIDDTIYTADTDFRVAIECNKIALDETIDDFERGLGIVCTLFGQDALNNLNHVEKLLKWALKYFSCGNEITNTSGTPDMDYIEDEKYIKSSFKYDYGYNPYEMEYLSWEDFFNDLNNLSNSEFGDCCVLSRVRNLRNTDVSKIKDPKEKERIIKAKKQVALKRNFKKNKATEEQRQSAEKFLKALGIERR